MKCKLFLAILAFLTLFANFSYAQEVIRDEELEQAIRDIAEPIFKVAGLAPKNVRIIIINDPQINAFVSGGQNIFIYTGLLKQSKAPEMIAGVLAHEVGHIAGGHLSKSREEIKGAMLKSTLGYLLGIAVAVSGSSPEAGQAIAAGTGQVVNRQILKYSRTHEEEADQAALRFLKKIDVSPIGLESLLEKLNQDEKTSYGAIDQYLLTHPLSSQRIEKIRNYLKQGHDYKGYSQEEKAKYERAIVKLSAFIDPYKTTLSKFSENNNDLNSLYARAIAYYKIPDRSKSIDTINKLLSLYPKDPYFNELKAQVFFENGKVDESIEYYRKSLQLRNCALFKMQLATALIASEKDQYLKEAIDNFEQAVKIERDNSFLWRQLGIAYGRNNQLDLSYLALAEEAFLQKDTEQAKKYIQIAEKYIKPNSQAELRKRDLHLFLQKEKKRD